MNSGWGVRAIPLREASLARRHQIFKPSAHPFEKDAVENCPELLRGVLLSTLGTLC